MHQHFPDPDAQLPLEFGAAPRSARDLSPLPPGGGKFSAPHYMTFGQIVNVASRTYRWTFDEALRHSRTNALAIRRDPVVMDALRSRQIPTAQLPWHIEAQDDQDSAQADAAKEATAIIEAIPHFQTLKMHLLEAIWWGRYASQLVYSWDFSSGRRRLKVRDHKPIHGDKLMFRYSGEAGVLVHTTFPGEWEATERGRAHFFTPEERQAVIIHKHEPEDADFFEPELAGSVEGVGIRSRIYWFWWLRAQISAFLMDYLERVGAGGFTIYYYEAGNQSSLDEVKAAAEEQHRNNTILFPRYKDGSTGGPGLNRIEPSNAGAQLLQALISNYFDQTIRRYILGQNLTSEAAGTGLGSGVADLHADTFARLVKYDAINLGETLTTDLVHVIYDTLFPGVPYGRFLFDVDKPNAKDVLESAQAFYSMGGAVDEDELRSIIGLVKPQPGHAILAKMGNLSPAGMPMGTPMMGQPGPDLGMGGFDPNMLSSLSGAGGPLMMSKRGTPVRMMDVRNYTTFPPKVGSQVELPDDEEYPAPMGVVDGEPDAHEGERFYGVRRPDPERPGYWISSGFKAHELKDPKTGTIYPDHPLVTVLERALDLIYHTPGATLEDFDALIAEYEAAGDTEAAEFLRERRRPNLFSRKGRRKRRKGDLLRYQSAGRPPMDPRLRQLIRAHRAYQSALEAFRSEDE